MLACGKKLLRSASILAAAFLVACGGGGGDSSGGTSIPAPSSLQYPTASPLVIQQAVSITPTITGQVTSYSVNPALPAGLSLNTMTGVISGTPTAITPQATYTITATNSSGSTTATLSLIINDIPPTVVYPSPYFSYTANVAGQSLTPVVGGGAIVGWSINPALPAGLSFDTTSGVISGTPTAAYAPTTFVVTATNSGGMATSDLTIAATASPLLDLGHADSVSLIRATGSVILSLDVTGHWTLQNYSSGTTIASGDANLSSGGALPVDLAGGVMMDAGSNGVEVRSTTDGHVLGTLPTGFAWYHLASDGSYVCAGSKTSLTAWTPDGSQILTQSGDYSQANVLAAPGQILAALGPAGQSVIQSISTSTGTSSTSASFQGTFSSWFLDGGGFLTTQGTVVWTYSNAVVQQGIKQLSSAAGLGGQGDWMWSLDATGQLSIYPAAGNGAAASLSQNFGADAVEVASNGTLALLPYGQGQFTTIDLTGATPTATTHSVPIAYLSAYAAIPGGAWLVGNLHGVLLDGATVAAPHPRYLTLGSAWSIAGGTSYFSIATASGAIYSYDAGTNALVSTIEFSSSALSSASSGAVLAAAANSNDSQYETARTINVYSIPSGTVQNTFNYTTLPVQIMSISGLGTVLEGALTNASGCTAEAVELTGGATVWCGTGTYTSVQLSPDGTLIAASSGGPRELPQTAANTNLYNNGTLVSAFPALAAGWLDNGRLLGDTYSSQLTIVGYPFHTSVIYDSTGNVLGNPPLPEILSLDVVSTNTFYSPNSNVIYSVTTGSPTWMSGNGGRTNTQAGAIGGSQVIFASGALVLSQPYSVTQ
jgi:Putative Ig domain